MTRTAVAAPPPGGEEPTPAEAAATLRSLVEDPVARALLKGERPFEMFAPYMRALIKYYDETGQGQRGVAQQLADALNAAKDAYLNLMISDDDRGYLEYVLREPGHFDGWHDVAAVTYDETEDRWMVTGD